MRTQKTVVIVAVALLTSFVVHAPARAGLVEVVASGVVSDTDLWYSLLPDAPGPVVGDPVQFRYVLDSDKWRLIHDNVRLYDLEEFTFSVGGEEFSQSGQVGQVQITDSDIADRYLALTHAGIGSFLGFDLFSIALKLFDSTGSALGGLEHPEVLDLADYDSIEFTAGCASCVHVPEVDPPVFWITPTDISVHVVPEPATVVLLILCAPMLCRRGRYSVFH